VGINNLRQAQRLWLCLFAALILGATGLGAATPSENIIVIGAAVSLTGKYAQNDINTNKVYRLTYALNAAICGMAGALAAFAYPIHAYGGLSYTIRAFMIVVVAGIGNLAGVVVAAFGLGVAESFAGFILGAQYQLAFVFGLLVAVLVIRNWRLTKARRTLR